MNRTVHEVIIRDEGLPTAHAALRSRIPEPFRQTGYEPEYIYQESALPHALSQRLIALVDAHDYCLSRECGDRWIRSAS